MKKALLLLSILFSLFAQSVKASDDYTKILEQMMRDGVVAAGFDMSSQYKEMEAQAPKLAEYLNGQYPTDMAEILAPTYRANCTLDELKQMQAYLSSPTFLQLMKKTAAGLHSGKTVDEMNVATQTILSGGTAADVKPAACSKEYEEALNQYITVMSMDKYAAGTSKSTIETLKNTMKKMAASLGQADAADESMAELEAPMKAMSTYMDKNMLTLVKNAYIETLSLDDLKALLKIKDQSFYPAYKCVNDALYANLTELNEQTTDMLLPKIMEALGMGDNMLNTKND